MFSRCSSQVHVHSNFPSYNTFCLTKRIIKLVGKFGHISTFNRSNITCLWSILVPAEAKIQHKAESYLESLQLPPVLNLATRPQKELPAPSDARGFVATRNRILLSLQAYRPFTVLQSSLGLVYTHRVEPAVLFKL